MSDGKGHTTRLAALAPPDRTGRIALLITLALLTLSCGGVMALCAGLEVTNAVVTKPAIAIFSLFFAGMFGLPYLVIILWLDRNEPEPWYLTLSALAWGGILATGLSGIFNTIFGAFMLLITGNQAVSRQLMASFSAPFIEEITKGAALVLLYVMFRKEFDNVLDGVVYGALVGLGFAVFENFIYYVRSDGLLDVFMVTWVRGVVAAMGGSHATFTALTGLGIGLFRVMRSGWLRWFFPPMGLALAMFTHFSWNTFTQLIMGVVGGGAVGGLLVGLPVAVVLIQLPFLLMVLLTATFALWHERRLIRKYLADEKPPVLLEGELRRLVPAWRRSLHNLTLLLSFQLRRWWITRKRNWRLVRLAFEKWHMDGEMASDSTMEARDHAVRVKELRAELRALSFD